MTKIRLQYVHGFRDRYGKVRFYFRRVGKRVPLPGVPGSAEFMAAYQSQLAGVESNASTGEIGKARTLPGTVNALIVAYYASAEFQHEFAAETQRMRRNILERLRNDHGEKRVALLTSDHIRKLLAKIARPHAKKNWLKTLRGLMRFGVLIGTLRSDPTDGVKLIGKPIKSDGFRSWSEEDIAAFRARHAVGSRARLALELLLGSGQRRGDVIRMGRQHIRNGLLTVRQNKTGAVLNIPIHAELQRVLDATPTEHLTFLTTAFGQPFTAAGFGNWFREMCDQAGLATYSAHGLRKAACRRLAEAGCTEKQIAAISGHASLNEVARYTRAADQTQLARAAMRKLSEAGA